MGPTQECKGTESLRYRKTSCPGFGTLPDTNLATSTTHIEETTTSVVDWTGTTYETYGYETYSWVTASTVSGPGGSKAFIKTTGTTTTYCVNGVCTSSRETSTSTITETVVVSTARSNTNPIPDRASCGFVPYVQPTIGLLGDAGPDIPAPWTLDWWLDVSGFTGGPVFPFVIVSTPDPTCSESGMPPAL